MYKRTQCNEGAYDHMMRTAYCKGFVPVHPGLHHTLPISQQRLDWANEIESETRNSGGRMIVPYLTEKPPYLPARWFF